MTATVENPAESVGSTGTGRVVRVIGPVVDVEFSADEMPEIYNALHVDITLGDETHELTLEVEQHIGDDVIRAISLEPTDGLVRGAEVTDTGAPISVPVGAGLLGRIINVIGEPVDEAGPVTGEASRSSTCSPRTCEAARSACSAGRAWARPC